MKIANIVCPLVVAVYIVAFMSQNPKMGNAYVIATIALALTGCVFWFSYGIIAANG